MINPKISAYFHAGSITNVSKLLKKHFKEVKISKMWKKKLDDEKNLKVI